MRPLRSSAGKGLAAFISDRHNAERPPVLWLGSACSISAGCFTQTDLMARLQIIGKEVKNPNEFQQRIAEHQYKLSIDASSIASNSRLGYSLLAQLVARGYFRIIVNSNWDSNFEDQLRILLPTTRVIIINRKDHPDEEIARLLANLPAKTVCVLRLYRGSKDVRRRSAYDFDVPLLNELKKIIHSHQLVFAGYSLANLHLSQVVSDINRCWFADPFTSAEDFKANFGTDPDHFVDGDDALFDNLVQGLCLSLLTEQVENRLLISSRGGFSRNRNTIDKLVDGISERLEADSLDDVAVQELTRKLLQDIRKFAAQSGHKVCLVFANDVESPGGKEIRTLIERIPDLKRLVDEYTFVTANIVGRSELQGEKRFVAEIEPQLKPGEFEAIVILDDISFSGNTLSILREYLITRFDIDPSRVVAGLLRIDGDLRSRLEASGWHVLFGAEHSGYGFYCPWGFARPTRAKLSIEDSRPFVNLKVRLGVSCFAPQASLGFVPKPWGELIIFRDNAFTSSRILFLERGKRTSLHYHLPRDEIFYVLDDRIRIRLWDRHITLGKNQSLRIPAGVPHSVIALESACRVLEIAEGFCDPQHDIVRIHDIYQRPRGDFGDDDGLI